MNREDLLNSITTIGTCEDENERRSLLTSLTDNVGKVFDEVDLLKKGTETLQETLKTRENELMTAQKYNMEMFLKLDSQRKESEVMSAETGIKEEPKKEYKSYSELAKGFMK